MISDFQFKSNKNTLLKKVYYDKINFHSLFERQTMTNKQKIYIEYGFDLDNNRFGFGRSVEIENPDGTQNIEPRKKGKNW